MDLRQSQHQTNTQQQFEFQQNNMSQQPSPSAQQAHDGNPQDVLAEARKNLQCLIDSGLSKELLHQLVDGSQALNLNLSAMTAMQTMPTIPSQSQPQTQFNQQTSNPNQSANTASLAPPPPMRCPPPPPVTSNVPSVQTVTTASSRRSSAATTPTPSVEIKHEVLPEEVNYHETAMFLPPQVAFSHRPRISVSSTSSGSSGHASIWSTNSGQSAMSWQSTSTCNRSQAPLPIPPSTSMNGLGPMAAPVGTAGKTNIYWCTSCETSFKRKYDWKRHEDEFHERWRKYPCPEPGCNRSFWGSNSFNQHHKQCHGCKTCPHAEKVVKFLRKRKYWACGFCSALHPARERHVEHVARHFESGMTKGDWMHSRVVYGLLHQPLIHEAWDALVVSKQPEYNGRRPQFSWHPSKTGRAQGFLENENPGQLQDLLEFFSGDEGEAQWIVSVAYDLADIVLTSAPIPSPQYSHASLGPQGFGHDPRMSFMPLPTQGHPGHQSLMPSPDPQQTQFTAPFRNTIMVPSQQFTSPSRPSPASSAHSPLGPSTSPLMPPPAPSPLEKRELPLPPPPQSHGHDNGESMMDFEYSPAPVVFDDWESLTGAVIEQPGQQHNAPPADWGMVQYFDDPRVTS
uniref:C2H2-type domain-containing protein n=1 Tax=Gibberella zeae TaxID=5518 RepID=A0A4E9DB02_GIBZA